MNKDKKVVKRKSADFILLIATISLVFVGIVMVFSSSWPEAMVEFNDGYHFLKKQLTSATLGFIALLFTMNIDYRLFKKFAVPIYVLSLLSGLLLFTPLGVELKGATRWINLGFTTFMPSDAIKVGSIIFFASFLANKKDKVGTLVQGTIPALIYIGLSCGLIFLQPDLGTTVTLAATLMAMFFVAGMKISHLSAMIIGAAAFLFYAIAGEGNEYRMSRWTTFLDPFADKLGDGWQVVQSLYALGSGGLFGLGLGKSRQKFFYIPEAYNDFIFSIIGEELGLFGTLLVLFLFLILIWRGVIIALKTDDLFGCYLASGITALITIQSLINIAVVTSSIPTTGITLPFISYGGTSLLFYMASVGILLNISRHAKLDRS
ncbi:putative lipid II flippase FtsW [Tissierella sp. Yu-01]|uniref:putative lipid II flippase FtsW n=1 Tax=Tissierella sp. Yu-01 TaxID=3035694 RepID=UPI00240E6E15|nr:putative lipid II flippase FtsW [Tissierella sp. Yu-01]WFA09631.1 putative lipid II flippase FtsW [Tissierella sp. Yu-01]